MNTPSTTLAPASPSVVSRIWLPAFLGLAIVYLVGHVQASALHAAAHDVRHATGFPCH